MDSDNWRERIEAARKQKDAFFNAHPQSPLPLEDQEEFDGLDYWEPDPELRMELQLHEYEDEKVIQVADTGGQERKLWKPGFFRFELDGQECQLHAYRSDPGEDRLFLPFRDETCGEESYGAGRYLDLEPDQHRTEDGTWVVDFNEAYNPWCAYSEQYVCPFVPPENWLDAPVRAGEKEYPLSDK